MSKQTRRAFTSEFKKQMVQLYENGKSRSALVAEYNLAASALDHKLVVEINDQTRMRRGSFTVIEVSRCDKQSLSKKLARQGIKQSVSRVGHCIDNELTEGLWGIVRSEISCMVEIANGEELKAAIDGYINDYNRYRYQERFSNLAPAEVRQAALCSDNPVRYPIAEDKKIIESWANIKAKQTALRHDR